MAILERLRAVLLVLAFAFAVPTVRAENYSDIWWNPSESGWGITIADHETQLFAVWFTYGEDNQPTWFVLPGGTFANDRKTFTGNLYQTSGPPYVNLYFDPSLVHVTQVGSATLDFAPAGGPAGFATFTATVNGLTVTKSITRQAFGSAPPAWGSDVTDIWWYAPESGWGLTLAQHGNNVFGVWYTYGWDGKPLFIVMPSVTFSSETNFTGTLYIATGPAYSDPVFDPRKVTLTEVGPATVVLHGDTASFIPRVNGFVRLHDVVRQPFGLAAPALAGKLQ